MTGELRTVLMSGDGLVEVRIPGPGAFVDPPPVVDALPDYAASLRRAMDHPLGMPPLERLVGRGARVVVAFDDPCLPLPPPLYDPRRLVLREVLGRLEGAGVRRSDLQLICANGLHRTWSFPELLPLVGPRVMARYGDRLRCYDAEDPDANAAVPAPAGVVVEVDRAVAEADLVVYVAVPWTEMNGGHKSIACGLSTYRSIRRHHDPAVQAASPLMHPERSAMHDTLRRVGSALGARVPVFQVETVMNNRLWAGPLAALDVHRPQPGPVLGTAGRLPAGVRGAIRRGMVGWYRPAGVWAGAVDPVHAAALERLADMRGGPAEQADILVLPVPNQSPYALHSRMNPLLTANLGLGYSFQFGRPQPLVRRGGWVVLASPCTPGFHSRHHPSYERFWRQVLPATRDSQEMARRFEPAMVADDGLREAYRFGRAYHASHPFFAWYWLERAREHLGGAVFAGAVDPGVCRLMGFDAAPDVEAAVELARGRLGRDARVAVQRLPPAFTVEVAD